MKRNIFTIAFIILFTSVMPAAFSEITNASIVEGVMSTLSLKSENSAALSQRVKKRKIKKAVRKTGRIYREVKGDRDSKKKSRKVQRRVNRIISIF